MLRNRIAALRAQRKVTQAALARFVGISRQALWEIERGGTPMLLTALRIARFFKLHVEDIFEER